MRYGISSLTSAVMLLNGVHGMKSVGNKAKSVHEVFTIGYVVFKYFKNGKVFVFWDSPTDWERKRTRGSVNFYVLMFIFYLSPTRDSEIYARFTNSLANSIFFLFLLKKRSNGCVVRIFPLLLMLRAPFLRHFCHSLLCFFLLFAIQSIMWIPSHWFNYHIPLMCAMMMTTIVVLTIAPLSQLFYN